ncbi:MAG: glycoside hydrolase family 43 protein [Barnesiella sp.]|nr:glycoside hydrolase family 43 protein [Barnesiella sp.]
MKNIIFSALLSSILSVFAAEAADNSAKFSYFAYQGNDEYYNDNPLTAPGDYFNPVISGWASDPSICRTGDDYWLVTSTFGYFPGVPLYHSSDLVSWKHVGNVLSRHTQLPWLEGLSLDKGGIYAPDLKYNPVDSTYYMITTCVMNGKDGGSVNFYVTAPHPLGPWSDPVILDGIEGIDPSFFFDDDGKTYIVYKSDEHNPVKWSNYRALSIVEFDTASQRPVGEPRHFREEGVGPEERLERNEGPHIFKKDGSYYMIAAEGGTNWVHSEVCYRADSVFGPFRRWSRNPMLTQRLLKTNRRRPVTSTGHADLVQRPDGEWFAVFLGCRPWNDGEDHLGRETYLMPVKWSADGFPYITQCLDTVSLRRNIPGLDAPQHPGQGGNFTWRDDFSASELSPEWIGLWGDVKPYAATGDGLRLLCAPVDARSRVTPAYLGRRIQHHRFTAETEVDFNPSADESAGLLMVKNETRQYYLALQKGRVSLYRLGKPGHNDLIASAALPERHSAVELKIESRGTVYDFYYRLPSADWQLLAADVPAEHIATQRGGFTGTTVGLYATSLPL